MRAWRFTARRLSPMHRAICCFARRPKRRNGISSSATRTGLAAAAGLGRVHTTSEQGTSMSYGLNIRSGALAFVSLGALVHRLDSGIIPFRKATHCQIHVSGGEFNVAANLSDCFQLQTGILTALVNYPIADLVAGRVKAMGVRPCHKLFEHKGGHGPKH